MGWAIIPSPGGPIGPCAEPCKHRDCNASRDDAQSLCRYCGKPIGFETPYYFKAGDGFAHADCEMADAEKGGQS